MSDTPLPDTTSSTPAASSKRPWTILGRLSQAVREQNWFAVALEVLIVVLGVVIGFQVTGWGQARADRVKEQVYLRQLAADLRETEREVSEIDARERVVSKASASLHHAFYQPEPPSADSLTDLIRISYGFVAPQPVLGTAEALIATGDISLVRDDSLRAAIIQYIDRSRSHLSSFSNQEDKWSAAVLRLWQRFDPMAVSATMPEALLDSLARTDLFYLPEGPRVAPAPIDREAFLSDTEARFSAYAMLLTKRNMLWFRAEMLEEASALREQVEAEIHP